MPGISVDRFNDHNVLRRVEPCRLVPRSANLRSQFGLVETIDRIKNIGRQAPAENADRAQKAFLIRARGGWCVCVCRSVLMSIESPPETERKLKERSPKVRESGRNEGGKTSWK